MENQQHSRDYQLLLDNIPGGVLRCEEDAYFTIIEVNNGFLHLFGYSAQELAEQFQNRFINMIYPDDRAHVSAEVARQIIADQRVSLNHRVLCKDGSYKWILGSAQHIFDENGQRHFFCILSDVTAFKELREDLRLTLERYQIILNQTTDVVFEWDLLNDTITYSSNWEKKFGYEQEGDDKKTPSFLLNVLHPDDMNLLRQKGLSIKRGVPVAEAEVRMRHASGRYIWCHIRATVQFNDDNIPCRAIGVLTDVDKQRKMVEELRHRAEHDALTGLFNRAETERRISAYLADKPRELCALFMIDADNFKQINDSQGHIFGDAVLTEIAAGMREITRVSDIIGRVGGDEFAIFLKNIPSREMAEEKACKLVNMFRGLFRHEKVNMTISCSIGVALYPQNGEDFQSLYHSADLALYEAKRKSKNCYVILGEDGVSAQQQLPPAASFVSAEIDSDKRGHAVSDDLFYHMFKVLYDAKDVLQAIQTILEVIGKRFDVSRAYILEFSGDGKYVSNTLEWCNEGITPQKDNLQNIPCDMLGDYMASFESSSVFFCRNVSAMDDVLRAILEPQGVCSLLHCAIKDENRLCGVIGFDECTGKRMWSHEEIDTLSLVSCLITTFLLKRRAIEHNEAVTRRLTAILDAQDAYVYAIAADTYKLLYLNHKTRSLDPQAWQGDTCYSTFFGLDAPCANCPIHGQNGEIYNPQYGVWTKVQVSPMQWDTQDAYLLACYDITEYKRAACSAPSQSTPKITYRPATLQDLDEIWELTVTATKTLEENNVFQWNEEYPNRAIFEEDIKNDCLTVGVSAGRIAVMYALNEKVDAEDHEAYNADAWQYPGEPFRALHRLCVHPWLQGRGVARAALAHIEDTLRQQGIGCMRLEAFSQNPFALSLYTRSGYKKVGSVNWYDSGEFYLMEKHL